MACELNVAEISCELIRRESVTGNEKACVDYLKSLMQEFGWSVEAYEVAPQRENLLVCFGEPKILLTTHLDVVPAPKAMFRPQVKDGVLTGRGACDAKGIAASMLCAAHSLQAAGQRDFALLFVVGEELDGIGARSAVNLLADRGIEHIINGEPTEGKLALGQKGMFAFTITVHGKACHSGYPEQGIDANRILIETLQNIDQLDLGSDETLGTASTNFGLIAGGTAANIISPEASASCLIRVVDSCKQVKTKLEQAVTDPAQLRIDYEAEPVRMSALDGFETTVVNYGTDLSYFNDLGAKTYLIGPGSIRYAHTDQEQIRIQELEQATVLYKRLVQNLASE